MKARRTAMSASIARTFFLAAASVVSLALVLSGASWTYLEYRELKAAESQIRADQTRYHKRLIQHETEEAVRLINRARDETETRLRETICARVEEAHAMATRLTEVFASSARREDLESIVREALRPIRYKGGRGYFFATRMDGVEELFADHPELEGRDLMGMKDPTGKPVIRDLIEIARTKGEGYYEYLWTKPGTEGDDHPKIAFIKYFEPFDWLIGTGEYLEDVERDVQEEVLGFLGERTFEYDGYLFAGRYDGVSIMGPAEGRNMMDVEVDGVKVVRELIAAAKAGGGFVEYTMPAIEGRPSRPKLSYAQGVDDWGWYVGAGIYIGDVEIMISRASEANFRSLQAKLGTMLGIHAVLLFGSLLITTVVLGRLRRQFDVISAFFAKAARGNEAALDHALLHHAELRQLGAAASDMVQARRHAEGALRRSERDLSVNNRIANAFLTAPEGEVYQQVLGIIAEALESPLGTIGYLDEEGNLVCAAISCDLPPEVARNASGLPVLPPAQWEGILARPLREGAAFVDNEATDCGPAEQTVHCALGVPLVQHGVLIGQIVAANRAGGYGADHLRLLESIAGQVAPVIQARVQAERHARAERAAQAEKGRLEARLRQSQKMEAVGELAGGVAHDFNNILQAITGYTDLAMADLGDDHPVHKSLNEVSKATARATTLVRQLLAFSRREAIRPRTLDLAEIIGDLMKMLRRVIGEHIDLHVSHGPDVPAIFADAGQVEQVLMNLLVNARDAMPAGGAIHIRTEFVPAGEGVPQDDPAVAVQDYVCLSVTDSGQGMDEAVRQRIFEPFFTTKEVGQGTGLGLATVYGIVKQHDGFVDVASSPGEGASFRLFFPACGHEASDAIEEAAASGAMRGTETLLLAEDDKQVRELAVRVLEGAGYTLKVARDGEEAIALFNTHGGEIALAVLDVIMPRKNGRAVFDHIMAVRPATPVLFSTGYSDQALSEGSLPEGGVNRVQKPYTAAQLLQNVRRVIDAANEGG